jgi:hypothetical protein
LVVVIDINFEQRLVPIANVEEGQTEFFNGSDGGMRRQKLNRRFDRKKNLDPTKAKGVKRRKFQDSADGVTVHQDSHPGDEGEQEDEPTADA